PLIYTLSLHDALPISQGSGLLPRHRAPDVIEHRRRIGPEIGDPLRRRRDVGDRVAADQRWQWRRRHPRDPRLALRTMTRGAFLHVDMGALGGRPGARRQPLAAGLDADVPGGDVGFGYRLPEAGPV